MIQSMMTTNGMRQKSWPGTGSIVETKPGGKSRPKPKRPQVYPTAALNQSLLFQLSTLSKVPKIATCFSRRKTQPRLLFQSRSLRLLCVQKPNAVRTETREIVEMELMVWLPQNCFSEWTCHFPSSIGTKKRVSLLFLWRRVQCHRWITTAFESSIISRKLKGRVLCQCRCTSATI